MGKAQYPGAPQEECGDERALAGSLPSGSVLLSSRCWSLFIPSPLSLFIPHHPPPLCLPRASSLPPPSLHLGICHSFSISGFSFLSLPSLTTASPSSSQGQCPWNCCLASWAIAPVLSLIPPLRLVSGFPGSARVGWGHGGTTPKGLCEGPPRTLPGTRRAFSRFSSYLSLLQTNVPAVTPSQPLPSPSLPSSSGFITTVDSTSNGF